ncbi:hypothetical protein AZE42_09018 [Rhizopogon vesiculosus]|uniref:Uncharacterized protein n=1 Tax=Rhizopogon vesiculosus TaxID=180088 RepID=A0A1J8PK95_9AGAM|nr:hypothetical protein AZE42_09018 [Rhizopogon vesiculosus]
MTSGSLNILAWTCDTSPYENFTVLLTNSNPGVLPAPLALIAVADNFECSETITQLQSAQPAGTGYVVQLSSTVNATDVHVYAQSEPFEIKALGATYPTTTSSAGSSATGSSATASSATVSSATVNSATVSSATTSSAAASSATTSSASPTTTGAALAQYVPAGLSMAAALALGLVVA